MSFRLAVTYAAAGVVACLAAGEAHAQANVLRECGSKYQAAKAANELAGQSWQDYLKDCKAKLAETPAAEAPKAEPAKTEPAKAESPKAEPVKEAPKAAAPAPAAAPVAAEAKPAAKGKDGKAAGASRQKKCGTEWKAQKADLKKADPKITWPKYLSSCVKRLKEAGE